MKPENKARVLEKLSPQMHEVMAFQASRPQPVSTGQDLDSQRKAYTEERRFWNEGGPEMLRTDNVRVPTRWGGVDTRIFMPCSSTPATLFYLHGGGFILGNLETHDRIMRLLAHYTGCTVIGVDYTLSPEAKFPQAIEETAAVCQFFHQHAPHYSLNTQTIGLAGDSAGAMLALASSLWIRENKIPCGKVSALLLWYGLYGLRDSVSRRLFGGSWDGLTQADLAFYEEAYLRDEHQQTSPYYCLFNHDLTRDIPPAYIASAEFDPLIDDSILLRDTLLEHGQACHYKMYPGTLHAFLHYSRIMPMADEALRDGASYFCQQLTLLQGRSHT
ncbi:acetyl esterase [Enterobacteriaceae bacterium 89]|nr:acetyl esterase [Enterobacteriaceae bacterium 89]